MENNTLETNDECTVVENIEDTSSDPRNSAESMLVSERCELVHNGLALSDRRSSMQSPKHPDCVGDVELLESTLVAWKNQTSDSDIKGMELKQQKKLNEMIKKNANERILDLEKSIEMLHKNIDAMHSDLNWIDDLHKEIEEMKTKNNELEEELLVKTEESERRKIENAETIANLKLSHCQELEKNKAEMMLEMDKAKAGYNIKLQNNQEEIECLKAQLLKVEKEKQSEISVLKLEHETKLRKLQQKKIALPCNQPPQSSFNQEIYRKKLQHLKTEYEQENTTLKNQVRFLQQQLNVKCVGRKSATK